MNKKCGYVAIIGRPNVGKSTLLNHLIGEKVSIISPKAQTTRHTILGIKTEDHSQTIYIDTPGIHGEERAAMNRYMNRLATGVITDADVIVFMIEATRWQPDDEVVLEKLVHATQPVILAINKIDLLKDKTRLLPLIDRIKERLGFSDIIPISVSKNNNIDALQKIIVNHLPEGDFLFPADTVTDKTLLFQVAECVREKLIRLTAQEIPYSTTVVIESLQEDEKIVHINALIWVEREGQKSIVIGQDGERLKKIGTSARLDLEKMLHKKVFLRLWVKVKDDWTNNERLLQDRMN